MSQSILPPLRGRPGSFAGVLCSLAPVAAVALSGCSASEPPTDWSLVGVYDAAAVLQMGLQGDDAAAAGPQYVWVQSGGMVKSCGPGKSPDGLGVFEASAMANGLTPTLAVLLQRNSDGTDPLTPEDVRVSLGTAEPQYQLYPAVMPRYVTVRIDGDADVRHKQLVRTQLEMELCMEHKAGHAWVGGSTKQLRQAFLLDPPDQGGGDRKYFGGQRDPVPALMGPPDACLQQSAGLDTTRDDAGRGDGSLDLIPSDVWGASLRWCDITETGGAVFSGPGPVPLTVGVTTSRPKHKTTRRWRELGATLHHADDDLDVTIDLTWDGQTLLDNEHLITQPTDENGAKGPPGLTDLLQRVPQEYPLAGTHEESDRYAILLVPNWQIVEGIRRMDQGDFETPMPDGGLGVQDGVGWVLDNPEHLFVQLPARADADIPPAAGGDETWLNVAEPLSGGFMGWNRWGYSPGMLAGRSPIVLLGSTAPTWEQVMMAHYTHLHALFIGALVALVSLVLIGMQRLGDLWSNVPEERVAFWPGVSPEPEEDTSAPPPLPGAS